MYDLHPMLLMNKNENKAVRKIFSFIEKNPVAYEERIERPLKKSIEKKLEKIKALENELAVLSESVLGRELGLRRFMVIDVIRDKERSSQIQVIEFSIFNYWETDIPNLWCLKGRNLRKDGCLGEKSELVSFNEGVIKRRQLNGVWADLVPKYIEEGADAIIS